MNRCSDYIWYHEYFEGVVMQYKWLRRFQCSKPPGHEDNHAVIMTQWFKQNAGSPVEVTITWPR